MSVQAGFLETQTKEVARVWELVAPNPIFELRAFHHLHLKKTQIKHFQTNAYDSITEFQKDVETAAINLNSDGYNCYTPINPINQEFNRSAARDADIKARELLFIDIDRSTDTKNPATDWEIEQSKELADHIVAFLKTLDWPTPIRIMSGNGHHIYYRLTEIENNEETKNLIKRTLLNLATRFNRPEVSIDTGVFNASRITKIPGTIARKGVESESRPYRMAVVL